MFFRLYKTRMKCLLKNKEQIFWSFAFPILLSIFFYMAFSNLDENEAITTIPIAITNEPGVSEDFVTVLKGIEIKDNNKLFDIRTIDKEKAIDLLAKDEIKGFVDYDTSITLYIKENGIEQSILKTVVDSYLKKTATIMNIAKLNPEALNQGILLSEQNFIENGSRNKSMDFSIIYFYSLIALACMFGCNWGFREIVNIQADQSAIGARINVAPTHKFKLLLSNLLATYTLHVTSLVIFIAFLIRVLKIEFGENLGLILLVCCIGSICGISMGAFICVTFKINMKAREAILTAVTIGGGFLAGMMNPEIKYIVATKAPMIGYINPATLVTDALYSLYYYEDNSRVFFNLIMLLVWTVVFAGAAYLKIRRREYASI